MTHGGRDSKWGLRQTPPWPTWKSNCWIFDTWKSYFPLVPHFHSALQFVHTWRRRWHPTPVLLPGKSHGQTSLVGCSPWGRKESDTTERLHFHFHFHALEKEMATHSSVLAWRIPGTGEPGGLPSMGSHRVGHDWSDLAAAAALLTLWIRSLFVWGGRAIHFRIFNQIPASYSLGARSFLSLWDMITKYVSKHCQIVFGGKIPPCWDSLA